MEKVAVTLGAVQETLLVPLLGRAAETRRANGLIHDPKAVEIVEALDYDFAKWRRKPTLAGTSMRTRLFDKTVEAFLMAHPGGTVVEIGAGLNTRYERLDNGTAQWVELDLPDSMALRRQFFEDTERRTLLAASALDTDWMDHIATVPGPYCFVSEAVLIYLDADQVEQVIRALATRFPGSWVVMDTTSPAMVEQQARHDVMKTFSRESWFRWRCEDPRALESWGLRCVDSKTFADAPADLMRRAPLGWRLFRWLAPQMLRKRVAGYRINRFELVSPGEP